MKRCPYCGEEVLDAAMKCRHCGEYLDLGAPTGLGQATTTEMPIGGSPMANPYSTPAPTNPYQAAPVAPTNPYQAAPVAPAIPNPAAPVAPAGPPAPGWWMASDGRWYPPQAPPPPPLPMAVPMAAPTAGWAQTPDGRWHQVGMVQPQMAMYPVYGVGPLKSKATAALLAFFLGGFGTHNFYLGRTNTAVVQLLLTIFGILTSWLIIGLLPLMAVGIWVTVDFIMILTGSLRDNQNRPLQ